MAKYDQIGGGGTGTAGKVFYNVYAFLCIIQSIAMIVSGVVYFNDCPGSFILNVYLIVQGALLVIFPIMVCTECLCGTCMKKVYHYTVCVIAVILCAGWLIAGSHWLDVSECQSSTSYKIALWFIVATWLLNGVFVVLSLVCCVFSKMHRY